MTIFSQHRRPHGIFRGIFRLSPGQLAFFGFGWLCASASASHKTAAKALARKGLAFDWLNANWVRFVISHVSRTGNASFDSRACARLRMRLIFADIKK
jgi:hypothetical protein